MPVAIFHVTGISDVKNWYRKQCQNNRNYVLGNQTKTKQQNKPKPFMIVLCQILAP